MIFERQQVVLLHLFRELRSSHPNVGRADRNGWSLALAFRLAGDPRRPIRRRGQPHQAHRTYAAVRFRLSCVCNIDFDDLSAELGKMLAPESLGFSAAVGFGQNEATALEIGKQEEQSEPLTPTRNLGHLRRSGYPEPRPLPRAAVLQCGYAYKIVFLPKRCPTLMRGCHRYPLLGACEGACEGSSRTRIRYGLGNAHTKFAASSVLPEPL